MRRAVRAENKSLNFINEVFLSALGSVQWTWWQNSWALEATILAHTVRLNGFIFVSTHFDRAVWSVAYRLTDAEDYCKGVKVEERERETYFVIISCRLLSCQLFSFLSFSSCLCRFSWQKQSQGLYQLWDWTLLFCLHGCWHYLYLFIYGLVSSGMPLELVTCLTLWWSDGGDFTHWWVRTGDVKHVCR